ncbi:MAG: Wzz/FepE/Etk N-terminal domain-containing protein [Bacteroidota bacterium]
MDVTKFLKLLKRHIFVLLAIPLITVIISYFLVRQLPNVYTSKARIATGLVDQSKQVLNLQDMLQESKTNQEFSNLLQMIQLKKVYDMVSYKLILHDLSSPSPFRKPSALVKDLNEAAVAHAIEVYTRQYENNEPLQLFDADQRGLNQVLASMGYDEGSLRKNMNIYRVNNSDFVDIEFQSENAVLSAFVANQHCAEFIRFYTGTLKVNQLRAITFLDSLQKGRKESVDSKMLSLRAFKIQNRILNLPEQAKILYSQITDFETKYDLAKKDIESFTGALQGIDNKFNPSDRQYLQSTSTRINQDIIATTNQLKILSSQYIKNNYNDEDKRKMDSLKAVVTAQINEATDRYLVNPLAGKENLVIQKINLQVQLDLAKSGLNTIKLELEKLNTRFDAMVPRGASLDQYQAEIDQAQKEYLDALGKYNQISLASDSSVDLKQIEYAMPGAASPSKKMLLIILSGIISFMFCVATLFILFYFDDHIKTQADLANKTGQPVLGTLPFIDKASLDLKKVWNHIGDDTENEEYRNMIRSLRFEIEAALGDHKKLVVTSIEDSEGKTFAILNLAYAYARTNKKVLVIDGNFDRSGISEIIRSSFFLEDVFLGKVTTASLSEDRNITVLANRGGNISLFEMLDGEKIKQRFSELESIFDMILIEASELKQLGKAKEWMSVADDVVVVFESNQPITATKKQYIDYLATLGNKFIGWILNKVPLHGKRPRKKR